MSSHSARRKAKRERGKSIRYWYLLNSVLPHSLRTIVPFLSPANIPQLYIGSHSAHKEIEFLFVFTQLVCKKPNKKCIGHSLIFFFCRRCVGLVYILANIFYNTSFNLYILSCFFRNENRCHHTYFRSFKGYQEN